MRCVAVIPARFGSTRLPGKPLLRAGGLTLIEHVRRRVMTARRVDHVIVATDDTRIAAVVSQAGGDARLTSMHHATGSDRIGELLPTVDADLILNVQGDEPDVDPLLIDRLIERLTDDPSVGCATAACAYPPDRPLADRNRVKVVTDTQGRALYFSRAAIPAAKTEDPGPLESDPWPLLHIGIYAYRRAVLTRFLALPRGRLERIESLEQLRLLENGIEIGVEIWAAAPPGIDTPEDFAAFAARYPD